MNQMIQVVYKARLEDGNWHVATAKITEQQWKKLKAEKSPKIDVIAMREL